MQRYFLDNSLFQKERALLDDESSHHALTVMRMSPGDQLIVCRMDGTCYLSELEEEPSSAVRLLKEEAPSAELPVKVTIAQGLPKGDKLESVLQKGTELGAETFLPFRADRSIVKLDQKKAAKKESRWQKIAKEAAEQAHRQKIPAVISVQDFEQLVKRAEETAFVLIAYEEDAKQGEASALHSTLSAMEPGDRVMVVIGPEGGLSEREVKALQKAGGISCAFGPRILRTETAPLYALSVLSYHFELLR
ncbi:MAG: 16S rRNA (uracil(1498)-N(3))-methyltransferase [Alkalicoccus sp.]|nr:MAG: 16S rRNA (uracil(1498)-N(3))-methyltransferase [Alkalicoccus sp.]